MILKFFIVSLFSVAGLFLIAKDILQGGLFKFFFYGGVSHFSVTDRWERLVEYWKIFLEHPIIGVSFGGGPFYLAKKSGIDAVSLLAADITNTFSPMNVTTEVLGSVGILGGLCFLYFFYMLASMFRSTLQIKALGNEEKTTLIALALSICVMFMTLQFNQSIMRAYIWIHIGIFCGYTRWLKQKYL